MMVSQSLVYSQNINQNQYDDWYIMYNHKISADGRWAYFVKSYDQGNTEGILLNTTTKKRDLYTGIGKFYLDTEYFFAKRKTGELVLKDLVTGNERIFKNANDFNYDNKNKIVIITCDSTLHWLNLKESKEIQIEGVKELNLLQESSFTLLATPTGNALLNKITGISYPISAKTVNIEAAIADASTNSLRIVERTGAKYNLRIIDQLGNTINHPKEINIKSDTKMLKFHNSNLLLSSTPLMNDIEKKADTVEVWSNRDKFLKSKMMKVRSSAQRMLLTDLSLDNITQKSYLDNETKHHLIFNDRYILEVLNFENYDFKISDLSPQPKIRLRNRSTSKIEWEIDKVNSVFPSRKLQYLIYFKDKNWHFLNVQTRKTKNITNELPADFHRDVRLNTSVANPIDQPYFSSDYKYIYFTSKNDIWKYSIQEDKMRKITHYHDEKISFRIKEEMEDTGIALMKWALYPVLKNNFLLVHLINTKSELHEGLGIVKNEKLTLIEQPKIQRIDGIKRTEKYVSYTLQDANSPAKLMQYAVQNHSKKELFNSKIENKFSTLPKTELREWINEKGEQTYVTVVLPPEYSSEKRYPAIVRVYENEARLYRDFVYPSYYNPSGFNRTLLALEGYIVILPKITYTQNKAGESALRAVEDTLNKVKNWYSIDSKNIGIIGHSFGGFETNYILTKSKLFKTAVSGSGIADIISDYFTVHKMYKNSNISRYTDVQFRFSDDFYSLKKQYLENSPILMADQIQTPLLLWSGKNDEHVEWRQSVAMFMALASLKKDVHLLLFPKDAHVLLLPQNQIEATNRIGQWFNYYLKNGEKPNWF